VQGAVLDPEDPNIPMHHGPARSPRNHATMRLFALFLPGSLVMSSARLLTSLLSMHTCRLTPFYANVSNLPIQP
jgi:hypothetical protein